VSRALLTDRYELTMVQAALHSGKADRQCVFEVFSRSLPAGRRYGVLAGTGRLLEAIRDFRFTESDLKFLNENQIVDLKTLDFLSNYQFTGKIEGYQEGELFFAESPVFTVTASFAQAVVLETLILSILNYDSAVASAAARMHSVAKGRSLVEMGSRRTQEESAVAAARAAYIAGFDATSNLQAGKTWAIPTMGTSAHSFTLLHDSEEQAFKAQIEALGVSTTLLVDTYDIKKAVSMAVKLTDGQVAAVRIDSGDLATTASEVREQLDRLGAKNTKIVLTSDLDEYTIAALASAPVDRFGVGTSVVTGSGHPTVGFVYKLVSHKQGNTWVDVAKKSKNKTSRGGKKIAYREIKDGFAVAELIGKKSGRKLQKILFDVTADPTLVGPQGVQLAKQHHLVARAELRPDALRLSKGLAAIPTVFS
jgi:nicotinate phosphoribosyltransferase